MNFNDIIQKLEEITSHLQNELSQLGGVVYSQQKEINSLKLEINKLKNIIIDLENNIENTNQKPPHY